MFEDSFDIENDEAGTKKVSEIHRSPARKKYITFLAGVGVSVVAKDEEHEKQSSSGMKSSVSCSSKKPKPY